MRVRAAGGAVALATVAVLLAVAAPAIATPAGELVQNGLFTAGEAGVPTGWSHAAYRPEPEVTTFGWAVDEAGIGAISIESRAPNDASWVQRVTVEPERWYRISGWVRTESVGTQATGAHLSVLDTFWGSRELRGTEPWQPVQLFVKTAPETTSLSIACRLGGYAAENAGRALCTAISVEATGAPVPGAPFVHGATLADLATPGSPAALVAAGLVGSGVALLLWRLLLPPAARIPP